MAALPAVAEAPALAAVDLVDLAVLARAQVVVRRAHRAPLPLLALLLWLLDKAHLAVPVVGALAALAVLVLVVRAGLPVLAGPVVVPAVRLRNRQWFSAAMARTTT